MENGNLDRLRFLLFMLDVMFLCCVAARIADNVQEGCIDISLIAFCIAICSLFISWCQIIPIRRKMQSIHGCRK